MQDRFDDNRRLVYSAAHKYSGRGLEYDDLVAEGMHGLWLAAEKFDESRGIAFSTFAHLMIKRFMLNAIEKHGSTVRIPRYARDLLTRYNKAFAEIRHLQQSMPHPDEVIDSLGLGNKSWALKEALYHQRTHEFNDYFCSE